MLRASLINGIGINLDADISKHIETLTDPGVFDGFIVANNNTIGPGKAWVQATRSNGETVFVYVEMKSEFSFSLTDGKIWIELSQEAIDNGLLNNEDWSGIASIKTWPTLPSQNFLLIATVTAGQVKDERNLIPKIQSVATRTTTLESKVEKSEKKIEKLEESGASSCLEYVWIFGDKEARIPAFPDRKKIWLCVNAKRIRFTTRYLQNGSSVYLNSIKMYDETWTLIPTSEYISAPAYINRNGVGPGVDHNNSGSILEFKKTKTIFTIEIVTSTNMNAYYMNADPVIDIDEGDGVWINCLWVPKNSFSATHTKKFTLRYLPPKDPDQVPFVRQRVPLYEVSDLELNLGKDAADKEIHIQRLSSGIPSDEISFKLKKVQLPITNIEVEVRKGVVVDVDAENCYWYGGELLASGVVMNNKLGEEYWRIDIKLNKKISLPKGGLYSVVPRQAGGVVNAANYYHIGCDMTQRSTAFGAVKVNGDARKQTKRMPFCESEAFLDEAILNYSAQNNEPLHEIPIIWQQNGGEWGKLTFFCPIDNPYFSFKDAAGHYWRTDEVYFVQKGVYTPINKNNTFQKLPIKRGLTEIWVKGYGSCITEIKFLFGSNTEELRVVAKNWEHYTLGKSYGFGLAGFLNQKRIGPQIDTANPTTSATTGTIAPGNYVSYLTVIWPDGKKYKIWAYAE